jgi:hypothetical protein
MSTTTLDGGGGSTSSSGGGSTRLPDKRALSVLELGHLKGFNILDHNTAIAMYLKTKTS